MGESIRTEPFQELAQSLPGPKYVPKLFVLASQILAVREVVANNEPQKNSDILVGAKWVRVYGRAEPLVSTIEQLKDNLEYEWEWVEEDTPENRFSEE